jgi:hypothetical protein
MFNQSIQIPEALTQELNSALETVAIVMINTPAFQAYDLPLATKYVALALSMENVAGVMRQTAVTLGKEKPNV